MPQMAPMLWLLLMLIFILCYCLIMMTNYFSSFKFNIKKSYSFKKNNFNWKW
uniref:ATP synthase complex subunit 8 n=1 Tax=Paradoxopsyllus custodis TaxID=3040964 RepID=A0AA95JUB2_9NEOP|nr:ATP synthase F0 subunit 8 [Paradoxopsyllus custodis]YP_011004240.1 ATP synthase F0 subunit 8 [Macrostylophora euteles]WGC90506.1 ATP synthase F0 subunit 8 [Paradoxopsyllus custodis]WPS93589.1 ATP synthase F0 subunit 8 [Macrostylophora euteles]